MVVRDQNASERCTRCIQMRDNGCRFAGIDHDQLLVMR
jgi:hypothetical protein